MQSILNNIVLFINSIAKDFVNIVTFPIMKALRELIPDFNSFISQAYLFIINYLLKGFQFIKMCILNITGLSHSVWDLVVITFSFLLTIFTTILAIKLAYNIWRTFQGSNGAK